MNRSKLLIAALMGLSATVSVVSATVLDAGAHGDAGRAHVAADRIAVAFASLPAAEIDPAIQTAAFRSQKGDLLAGPACDGQRWPHIAPECLVTADGRAVRPARTVTVGYQTGDATSVLIRMPAPQVASR